MDKRLQTERTSHLKVSPLFTREITGIHYLGWVTSLKNLRAVLDKAERSTRRYHHPLKTKQTNKRAMCVA